MKCLAKSEGCSVFRMENATGEGTIAMYELFPGVMLGFNDFHMDYFDSEFVPQKHVFCIDHCREGRMQYVADEDAYAYVEAGDLKLDRSLTHTGHFEFPLAHYGADQNSVFQVKSDGTFAVSGGGGASPAHRRTGVLLPDAGGESQGD